jgi:ribosomal protein L3 glutamine methyltransferase
MTTFSLLELIQDKAQQLEQAKVSFGHGTTNAFDEAAWLVLWQLGLPLDTSLETDNLSSPIVISPEQVVQVQALIDKRISTRQPAAYLTQEAWLQGVPFYIDERSIVPRSLIAEVIADGSIDAWLSDETRRVLDLCTGNGSLAVIAAMAFPEVSVVGADISLDALEVAKINRNKHDFDQRIELIQSDGLNQVEGLFDLVLCNPPYVNSQTMATLPQEYLAEPTIALAGGSDGMDFIREMLIQLPEKMSENGILILEIGNEREYFEAAFPQLWVNWLPTSAGEDQVLLIERDALLSVE